MVFIILGEIILGGEIMGEERNVEKENVDGHQINHDRIWKKNDEVEENDDETIAILIAKIFWSVPSN